MTTRQLLLAVLLCGFVFVAAPQAKACSFQMIDSYSVTVTVGDETTTYIHEIYAWVGCGGDGGFGEPYDPWPGEGYDGGSAPPVGPPAPPPPPAPPTTDPCSQCQDQCWAEYSICIGGEQDASWWKIGSCGILCRESCRLSRDSCLGGCITDGAC